MTKTAPPPYSAPLSALPPNPQAAQAVPSPPSASAPSPRLNIKQIIAAGPKARLMQYAALINRVKAGETLPLADQKVLAYLENEIKSDEAAAASAAQAAAPGSASSASHLSGRSFSTLLAVTTYLTEQGYKVGKSTVYNDHHKGMLRKRKNGTYALEDVDRYAAAAHLSRIDGTSPLSPQIDAAQKERIDLDLRRERAETETCRAQLNSRRRDLITGPLQQELAARIIVLRADLENFFRGQSLAIINLVSGDAQRVPDLLAFCLTALETMLARYAQDREYRIVDASADDPDAAGDAEAEGEDGEKGNPKDEATL